ncbi:uncharacterized protein LOC128986960 [Macrosteles quadrilineatus]|uniref:uncharacterized protein LOC128986960 n=1 Tax=Macrosteles quadrilineatus TaxID=74068 RepID=UPI0023E25789|nr:uncharacterized protein LOC128986960 [Macrosteles quadrilineatus]
MLALLLLDLILVLAVSSLQTERQTRSDVRTMMDKLDPNFWPTRGRRSSTSSEETPPPFWANRGRAIEELETMLTGGSEEVAPPFWAHRGRELLCPDTGTLRAPLTAEEPRWVMFNRRDAEDGGNEDALWISQGPRGFDGLTSREQEFWVSRGKKLRSEKKDSLRSLSMPQEDFYPARGKRSSGLNTKFS